MSPIRAEDRDRYPADWAAISLRIRTVRAGGRCECKGQCGRTHRGRCRAWNGKPHPVTESLVVLTVAHLDHTPENCSENNLCAMCQACHPSYDADHHAATRARTRHADQTAGMDALFEEGPQARTEPPAPQLGVHSPGGERPGWALPPGPGGPP